MADLSPDRKGQHMHLKMEGPNSDQQERTHLIWEIHIVPFKGFGPLSCHLSFHHCWCCYLCRSNTWINPFGIKILDHRQIYVSIIALFCTPSGPIYKSFLTDLYRLRKLVKIS